MKKKFIQILLDKFEEKNDKLVLNLIINRNAYLVVHANEKKIMFTKLI